MTRRKADTNGRAAGDFKGCWYAESICRVCVLRTSMLEVFVGRWLFFGSCFRVVDLFNVWYERVYYALVDR